MNVLIDINHPAQVHYFRNLYKELSLEHNIYITCKKVPLIEKLISAYNIPYISYGEKKDNILSKAFYQLKYDIKML
jgi:predicted glycosyltransferase